MRKPARCRNTHRGNQDEPRPGEALLSVANSQVPGQGPPCGQGPQTGEGSKLLCAPSSHYALTLRGLGAPNCGGPLLACRSRSGNNRRHEHLRHKGE